MSTLTNLVLRRATLDDLETLIGFSEALNMEDGHPVDLSLRGPLEALLNDDRLGAVFLIERDGSAIGSVFMCFGFSVEFGGRDAFIDEIYIVPEARGEGAGGWALRAMDAWAKDNGLVALHLEVMAQNPALKLYQKHGYEDRESVFMSKRFV